MKIGILETGPSVEQAADQFESYTQLFGDYIGHDHFEYEQFVVYQGHLPKSALDADGWLITGSRFGAYEGHDWIPPLEDLIREIHAAKRPLIGVCFGHQIVAQALGGKVEKFKDGWAVGRQSYQDAQTGDAFELMAWHQDQVIEKPQDARVLASSDFCKYAALAYGDHIYTIQPHPEFGKDVVEILLEHKGPGVVEPQRLEDASETVGLPVDQDQLRDQFRSFFIKS